MNIPFVYILNISALRYEYEICFCILTPYSMNLKIKYVKIIVMLVRGKTKGL
jgi:hypothetical protein